MLVLNASSVEGPSAGSPGYLARRCVVLAVALLLALLDYVDVSDGSS